MTCHLIAALIAALLATASLAKLPPLDDEAKARATEIAAKTAWADKVAFHQLCVAQDKVANAYRKSAKAAGKPAPEAIATALCSNPGPYQSQVTPATAKPLEASGAHSPPGIATSPPSTKATAAEIEGRAKK
jgi:hypothetical protein